jgi:hypothetical protein
MNINSIQTAYYNVCLALQWLNLWNWFVIVIKPDHFSTCRGHIYRYFFSILSNNITLFILCLNNWLFAPSPQFVYELWVLFYNMFLLFSAIGIAIGWAVRPRSRSSIPCGGNNFHFSMWSIPSHGSSQPAIQWVQDAVSPRLKRPGREADHSAPTNAEVKKTCLYTSTPPYVFMT